MDNLTENEEIVIRFLRDAKPYERITIQKDHQGKLDNFIIQREQKIILTTISRKEYNK